ncbi:MAG TPA: D-alanine--D-alanine ligase, partial [Micavibrio sp.]
MPKKVALLTGGWSAEREVSLTKGRSVEAGLKEAGYDVTVIDVRKDLPALIAALTPKPDVAFCNLYGRGGEDGTIQSVLEILEIPYTH